MPQSQQQTRLQKISRPTIVLTGGGSGGHITPLLSLAHELKTRWPKYKVAYIGLKGEKVKGLSARYNIFDDVYFISSGKFRRYSGESILSHLVDLKTLLLNARDFFKVIFGIFSSRRILKKLRPGVVFSKGGYVAVPVGIAAKSQNIPIITHDSDTVPGLANKILGRWAAVRTAGMPTETHNSDKTEIRFVGIPVDERIRPVTLKMQRMFKSEINAKPDELVLLVGGAGLGARDLNNHMLQIAPELLGEFKHLRIYHLAGAQHSDQVQAKYEQTVPKEDIGRVNVMGFTEHFYKYTGAADLIVTRAGATTIAELAMQGKAALLMPAPFLAGGHQIKNARQLQKLGAAAVVPNDINDQKLYNIIRGLLLDDKKRGELSGSISGLAKPDAAKELAEILVSATKDSPGV